MSLCVFGRVCFENLYLNRPDGIEYNLKGGFVPQRCLTNRPIGNSHHRYFQALGEMSGSEAKL